VACEVSDLRIRVDGIKILNNTPDLINYGCRGFIKYSRSSRDTRDMYSRKYRCSPCCWSRSWMRNANQELGWTSWMDCMGIYYYLQERDIDGWWRLPRAGRQVLEFA